MWNCSEENAQYNLQSRYFLDKSGESEFAHRTQGDRPGQQMCTWTHEGTLEDVCPHSDPHPANSCWAKAAPTPASGAAAME